MPLSIREFLERRPATSKELQGTTGLSQAAVSRQLRGMGDSVIKLPGGRSPRYAMTRNAFGGDDRLPLFMVDAHGNNTAIAYLRPLAHGGFFVEPLTGMPQLLLGERGDGLYDDLPYFLQDLRPQGFLGRQIAAELASRSEDFLNDPRNWSSDQIGRYLISNGDDLPGNFKLGQPAYLRFRSEPVVTTEEDYPALAESVMSGTIPGSSAGGEQPKFTAFNGDRSAHVIVKFSPSGDDPVARCWRDILITEFHAIEAIHEQKTPFPAAETRLIERGGRLFLESERFDRKGKYGRMSMVSLQSVDAEFTGFGSDWPRVMDTLCRKSLVGFQYLYKAQWLHDFGLLINNKDLHLGNLSLMIDGNVFRLLPVYDMCSMGFAPKGGEVMPYNFTPPEIKSLATGREDHTGLKQAAHTFWERVAADKRISDELREFLGRGNPITL